MQKKLETLSSSKFKTLERNELRSIVGGLEETSSGGHYTSLQSGNTYVALGGDTWGKYDGYTSDDIQFA